LPFLIFFGPLTLILPIFALLMVVSGGVVSTVKVRVAGLWSHRGRVHRR
jgi:hypothetical protein